MVFRRQQGLQKYLHPVNTIKHVVDSQLGVIAAAQSKVTIADAVDNPALASPQQVVVGSYVRSLFLNIQVAATGTAALANIYMIIYKNPSNDLVLPNANVIGTSDLKKVVFHQDMTMTEKNTTAISRTLFKGVLRVPKHMQRMGQDDRIEVQLFAPGVNFDVCLQSIYKEIR